MKIRHTGAFRQKKKHVSVEYRPGQKAKVIVGGCDWLLRCIKYLAPMDILVKCGDEILMKQPKADD